MQAADLQRRFPFIDSPTAERLARSYGSDALSFYAGGSGRDFGHGLFAAEVDWLVAQEWAHTVDDVLWRRSKLGLQFTSAATAGLREYLANPGSPRCPVVPAVAAAPQTPDR